ncbi:hypothetical protein T07_4102 [Trichinella nelsoni]|uniref:Uncharacterized protein n=1 Tax=Trichinella nelsoni TaxID=6336 RepID=A0A0V0S1T9_9BILA|nr:hypothetical protein T07_4102 [Trichinella nelsoni]
MIDAPHAHGPREELLSIWPAEEPLAVSLQPHRHKNHFKSAWYNGTLLVTIGRLLNNFLLHLGFGSASATLDYWTKAYDDHRPFLVYEEAMIREVLAYFYVWDVNCLLLELRLT